MSLWSELRFFTIQEMAERKLNQLKESAKAASAAIEYDALYANS